MTSELTYCPACGRTDDEIGKCGRGITPCPDPVAVDPTKQAVLNCGPCGRTVVIPVSRIMRGKMGDFSRECSVSECAATLLFPSTPAPAPQEETSLRMPAHKAPKTPPAK